MAVIGGGVAGVTAAAGAARKGCHVTVFEKDESLLHLFAGCTKRWLHPRIYDWPQAGSLRDDADDLEVLTWHASTAGDLVDQLRAEWEELRAAHGIEVLCGVTVNPLQPETSGRHPLVTWRPGANTRRFRVVILAVGFGIERAFPGLPQHSYWHDDALDQSDHGASKRYLISGLGDGGLIEFVRACIGDFRHDQIVNTFELGTEKNPKAKALGDQLLAIEDEAARHERVHGPGTAAELLWNAYTNGIDDLAGFVDEALAKRRRNRKVMLNGIGHFPITRQASILNRLLTARLLHRQHADYWPGRLHTVSGTPANGWQVILDNNSSEHFHDVFIRHGTESALGRSFPTIAKVCQQQLGPLSALDQTRVSMWPSGYFILNTSVSPRPRSVVPPEHPSARAVLGAAKQDPASGGSRSALQQGSISAPHHQPTQAAEGSHSEGSASAAYTRSPTQGPRAAAARADDMRGSPNVTGRSSKGRRIALAFLLMVSVAAILALVSSIDTKAPANHSTSGVVLGDVECSPEPEGYVVNYIISVQAGSSPLSRAVHRADNYERVGEPERITPKPDPLPGSYFLEKSVINPSLCYLLVILEEGTSREVARSRRFSCHQCTQGSEQCDIQCN